MMKGGARLFLATSLCALTQAALAGEVTTYSYDALGRLTASSSSGTVNNGQSTTIGYDPAGNRASYAVTGAAGPPPPPVPPPSPVPPPAPVPPPPPGNQPPVTVADSGSVARCGIVIVNVVANDTDPEANYPLVLQSVSTTLRGYTSVASGTSVRFESRGSLGSTSMTYTVADSLGATSTGTLVVTVEAGGVCQ